MFIKSKFATTYILGGIFIILVTIVFLLKGNFGFLGSKPTRQFIPNLNIEAITKIELKEANQTYILEKRNNQWVVSSKDDVKANQEAVLRVLNKTKELTKDEVASKNPEKKAIFQVDQSGLKVKFYKGETEVANFYVGKVGPDFSSTYIRKEGEDIVYLFKENIIRIFNQSDWRDLTILSFDKTKVKSLTLVKNEKPFVVEKVEDKWKLTSPLNVEVNQDKLNFVLNDLSNLKGKDIITDKKENELGFEKPALKITISFKEEGEQTILIGGKTSNEGDADYYAKKAGSETIFTLSKFTVESFPAKIEDFLKEA